MAEGVSIKQNGAALFCAVTERQYPAFGSKSTIEPFARQEADGWTSVLERRFEFQRSSEMGMAS